MNVCADSRSAACQTIRTDYAAAAVSFLPTDGDIWTWGRTQAGASNGRYSAAEIYDAYRTSFIAGAVPNMSVGDLTQAAEWMRSRIVGDGTAANPGEGPLSPIAMGWAVGNNALAQGALSARLLAMAGTVRIATLALDASLTASAPAVLAEQQRIRLQDIADQFNDKSITPANMNLRLGGRTLKADPTVSDGAPVFIGAADAEIAGYFRQIAGVNAMPQPSANALAQGKTIYAVKVKEGEYAGSTITIRDYSSSKDMTCARWTIDIDGHPAEIAARTAEIKFK